MMPWNQACQSSSSHYQLAVGVEPPIHRLEVEVAGTPGLHREQGCVDARPVVPRNGRDIVQGLVDLMAQRAPAAAVVDPNAMAFSAPQELKFTTDLPCEVSNINWELKNFKALTEIKESLKTVKLHFEAGRTIGVPSKWCFFLRRDGDEIGVYLELLDSAKAQKEVFARFDTIIKRIDGTNFQRLCTETIDMKGVADWGWNNIGTTSTLIAPKSNLLVDGTLSIQFRFEIYTRNTINSGKKENEVAKLRSLSRSAVADDLLAVFTSGINSDVTIQMKDLKKFNVHRLILAARSPVFLAMFETKMKESVTGSVQIDDMSSRAMEVLLKHVYSGSLENDWIEVAEEVIYAAEKYNMPLLKEFCDKMLINACNNETALDLFKVARLHSLETATKDISDYIKTNIGSVLQSC